MTFQELVNIYNERILNLFGNHDNSENQTKDNKVNNNSEEED